MTTNLHPLRCEMWVVINPDGTFMDETVSMKRNNAIYKGFVWGRCGDDRTQKDFEKEGYRVVKVDVILHTSANTSDKVLEKISIRSKMEEQKMKVIEFIKRNKEFILQIIFTFFALLVVLYIGYVIFWALITNATMCLNCTVWLNNDPMSVANLIKTAIIIGIMSISFAVAIMEVIIRVMGCD